MCPARDNPDRAEGGNALFLILIAVVLFAALSFAVTQSNRGMSNTGQENAALAASSIMQAVASLTEAHMRLNLRGLSAAQEIVMIGPADPSYQGDPDLARRNLIHPSGGGAPFQVPGTTWVETVITPTAATSLSNWKFVRKQVLQVGSNLQESVVLLSDVRELVCRQLNRSFEGDTSIPELTVPEAALLEDGGVIADAANVLAGRHTSCVRPAGGSRFFIYHVLTQDDGGAL